MTPDEYCRDTTDYQQKLTEWQVKNADKINDFIKAGGEFFLVAADILALYPSINRKYMKRAILDALKCASDFPSVVHTPFMELTIYCVENVITQYQELFVIQENWLVTGDFHCVWRIFFARF